MSSAEFKVFMLGATVVLGLLTTRALKAWFAKPASPDPWGPEVAKSLEEPNAIPLCPHCQCPHEVNRWFCPECGRAVGECTNLLAPFYAYSIGDVLRCGINNGYTLGTFRTAGTIGVAAAAYLAVAPLFLEKAFMFVWVWLAIDFPPYFILWPIGLGMLVSYLFAMFGEVEKPAAGPTNSPNRPAI